MAARKVALEAKLQQIRKIKDEVKAEIDSEHSASSSDETFPRVTGLSDNCIVQFADGREIKVIIGTSEHIQEPLIQRICRIVDEAYTKVGKHKRVDRYDAVDRSSVLFSIGSRVFLWTGRIFIFSIEKLGVGWGWNLSPNFLISSQPGLEMGDAGPQANRVLHLAFKGDELVGCASSTFSPGWTPEGCGHWGLLAVDPSHQNSGVATALVIAAERRLATTSAGIQIEYQYTEGDSFSQRCMLVTTCPHLSQCIQRISLRLLIVFWL